MNSGHGRRTGDLLPGATKNALLRRLLPVLFALVLGATGFAATPATAAPILHAASCAASEYQNVDGDCVPRPEQAPTPPDGATAQCRDGAYSFSRHHTGTCSGHGGVAQWL